jgi:hypothetical protein
MFRQRRGLRGREVVRSERTPRTFRRIGSDRRAGSRVEDDRGAARWYGG